MFSPAFIDDGLSIFIVEAKKIETPSDMTSFLTETQINIFNKISSESRKVEFLATRYLAFSIFSSKVETASTGAPIFPKNRSGSISHKNGIIAIAVSEGENSYVGIDLERNSVKEKLSVKIAPNEKLDLLCSQSGLDASEVLSLCFSAKESIYKAVFPSLTGQIGFSDVCLEKIDQSSGELIFSSAHKQSLLADRPIPAVKFKNLELDNLPYILTYIKILPLDSLPCPHLPIKI